MKHSKLPFLGFLEGFFGAALGIGGGALIVSTLVIFFKYKIKKAVGTSLATIVPTAFVGAAAHYIIKTGNIKFIIVLFTLIGSIMGEKYGVKLESKLTNKNITRLFALLLIFSGLNLLNIINIPTQPISNTTLYPILILVGLFAGICSALFGIGGGVILVPALNLFFGLTMHEAIATSLTIIVPTTFVGALFHEKFHDVDNKALKFLIPPAIIGAVLGAIVTNNLPSLILKISFGVFMVIASLKLFSETLKKTAKTKII